MRIGIGRDFVNIVTKSCRISNLVCRLSIISMNAVNTELLGVFLCFPVLSVFLALEVKDGNIRHCNNRLWTRRR